MATRKRSAELMKKRLVAKSDRAKAELEERKQMGKIPVALGVDTPDGVDELGDQLGQTYVRT